MRQVLIIALLMSQSIVSRAQLAHDLSFGNSGVQAFDLEWFELPIALIGFENHLLSVEQIIAEDNIESAAIGCALTSVDGQTLYAAFSYTDTLRDHLIPKHALKMDDDKVLIIGDAFSNDSADYVDAFMLMINSWGEPVTDFGDEGWMFERFLGHHESFNGLTAWNSTVVLAGSSLDSNFVHKETPVLLCMQTDGSSSDEFGDHGKIALDMSTLSVNDSLRHEDGGFFTSVSMTDDHIYAAGAWNNGIYNACLVASFLHDGSLDESFGDQGVIYLDYYPGNNNWIDRLLITPSGNIVGVIKSESGDDAVTLIRLTPEGSVLGVLEIDEAESLIFEDLTVTSFQEVVITARALAGEGNALESDRICLISLDAECSSVLQYQIFAQNSSELTGMELYAEGEDVFMLAYVSADVTDAQLLHFDVLHSIDERVETMILWPNPTTHQLHLSEEGWFSILSLEGELVMEGYSDGSSVIDVHALQHGVYIYRSAEGSVQKFIKSN